MDKKMGKMQEFNQIRSREAAQLKETMLMERPEVRKAANKVFDVLLETDLSYIEAKKAIDYADQLLLNRLLNYQKIK